MLDSTPGIKEHIPPLLMQSTPYVYICPHLTVLLRLGSNSRKNTEKVGISPADKN